MRVIVAAVALLFATAASAGWRIDGNSWRNDLSGLGRVAIVRGYVEGFSQAQMMAPFYVCVALKLPASADCFAKGAEAVEKSLPDFTGLTFGQIGDGLDAFYGDYRNRKIELPAAMVYVVKAIRGTPAQEMEKLAEDLRKYAPK